MGRTRRDDAKLKPRIRFDLRRMGVGIFQVTAPQKTQTALRRYYGVIAKLIEDSQVTVLRAVNDGKVSLDALVDLDRAGKLKGPEILGLVVREQPFLAAWDSVAARLGKGPSAKRYAVTRLQLERKGARWFTKSLKVDDLANPELVPWETIAAAWDGSAADWNHLRKATSRVLTLLFGDKYHAFRRQVVQQIPTKPEPQRVPNISADTFWRVVAAAREDTQPAFVTLVATGMRVGEYLACTAEHLRHEIMALAVPGTKTEGSAETISIDALLWPWVVAGIPSPLRYKRLRMAWAEACTKAEVEGIHLHDLRHLHGQLASDHGEAATAIASSLRHANINMTMRYARTTDTRKVSAAVASRLGLTGQSPDSVNLKSQEKSK